MIGGYVSIREKAEEWGITPRRVQTMCAAGRIEGAGKIGNMWVIPIDAKRPIDKRVTTGKYRNWRKKQSDNRGDKMNQESFSFVIYMIHACANKWQKLPTEIYRLLQSTGCIDGYLVPHYDVLHTQSTDYVVEDIKDYLGVRGVSI